MNTQFRNALHYIVGGLIGFGLFQTFQGKNLIPEYIVATIVLTAIGAMWEIGRKILYGYKPDFKDVKRGVIGGLVVITILNMI
jgi:ammonia channel protein AmtB